MPPTAYWLTYEVHPHYLLARVQGLTDSLQTSISFWQEIISEAHAQGVKRLLVEENFRNNLSTVDMRAVCRFIAEQLQQLGMLKMPIAFLDVRLEQFDDNRAGEETALELGLCVRIFNQLADAERWLLAA